METLKDRVESDAWDDVEEPVYYDLDDKIVHQTNIGGVRVYFWKTGKITFTEYSEHTDTSLRFSAKEVNRLIGFLKTIKAWEE